MYTRLSLKTEITLRPDMVLASQLMGVSGEELEELIMRELRDNPALSLKDANLPGALGQRLSIGGTVTISAASMKTGNVAEEFAACPSAIQQLESQIRLLASGGDLGIALYLVNSLDERGYLDATPVELATQLGTSTEAIERGIQVLHQLEPPGIGARNLPECLLLQCKHLEDEGVDCQPAQRIIADAWDDFIHQRWRGVAHRLDLLESDVKAAASFMARNLYPYPLRIIDTTADGATSLYGADLIIHREQKDGRPVYRLEIPAAETWELHISDFFVTALRGQGDTQQALPDSEKAWIKSHLRRARLFLAALGQRWNTLRRIGQYLIEYQVDFLNHGTHCLKPLTRNALAQALNLHESTVCRAISNKTVQLPHGQMVSLTSFVEKSLPAREAVRRLLAGPGKTLSDRQIADKLCNDGVYLSRRTVAKYRQQLKLLPSYYRKADKALSWMSGG